MLMLASSSSSPSHRGSIERGVDGGDHRVIGGLATEMCSDRLQEMIALSDRKRRRRALQQRELLARWHAVRSIKAAVEQIIPEMVRHLAQHATNSVGVIIVTVAAVIHGVPAGAMGVALQ
jgi:hypothetical protein